MKSLTRALSLHPVAWSYALLGILLLGIFHTTTAAQSADPNASTVEDLLRESGEFTTFIDLLELAGMSDMLDGSDRYTYLVPNDQAFAALGKETRKMMRERQNRDTLRQWLELHTIRGVINTEALAKKGEIRSMHGDMLAYDSSSKSGMINGVEIMRADLSASNGMIHEIANLLPPRGVVRLQTIEETVDLMADVPTILNRAISLGAPIYNNGNHAACTAIYEVAALGVLNRVNDLPREVWAKLYHAIEVAKDPAIGPSQKAWTLRRAMDAAIAATSKTG